MKPHLIQRLFSSSVLAVCLLFQSVNLTSAVSADPQDSIVSALYMQYVKPYQRPQSSQQTPQQQQQPMPPQPMSFEMPVKVGNEIDELTSQLTHLTNKQKKMKALAQDSHEADIKTYSTRLVKLLHSSTVDGVVELNDKWMTAETVESINLNAHVTFETAALASTANHLLLINGSSLHIYSKHTGSALNQLSLSSLFTNSDNSQCGDSAAQISAATIAVDKLTRPTRLVIIWSVERSLCTVVSVNSELTSIHRAVFELPTAVKSLKLGLMPTVYQLVVEAVDDSVGLLSFVRSSMVRNRFSEPDAVYTAVDFLKTLTPSSIDGIVKVSIDRDAIPSNMTRLLFGSEPIWVKGADWGTNRPQRNEFALTIKDTQLIYTVTHHDYRQGKHAVIGLYTLPQLNDFHNDDVILSISTRFVAHQLPTLQSITAEQDLNHHDEHGNPIEELMMVVVVAGKNGVEKLTLTTVDGELLKLVRRERLSESSADAVHTYIDRRGNAVTLQLHNNQLSQLNSNDGHVIGSANKRMISCLDVDECGVWTLMKKQEESDNVAIVRVHNESCPDKRHVLHPHAKELQDM